MENKQVSPGSGTVPPPPRSSGAALGIVLLGIGFIFASLGQVGDLISYSRWRSFFPGHPGSLTQFLYLISWGTSLLGVVVGIGLFSFKEFFRKAGVFLVCVSIVGAYGRHPHEGFIQRMQLLTEQMAASGAPYSPGSVIQFVQTWNISWLTESALAWGCVVLIMIFEILLVLVVIFFLTRPSVKALFR